MLLPNVSEQKVLSVMDRRVKPILFLVGITLLVLLTVIVIVSPLLAQDPREMLVSLVQLIANPTVFDGKRVILKGYVVLEFESQHMYLSEADATHGITRNSVWLDVSHVIYAKRAQFHGHYIFVEGTFSARRRGHLGMASGEIGNISRFDVAD
jgi:hypothetical protein